MSFFCVYLCISSGVVIGYRSQSDTTNEILEIGSPKIGSNHPCHGQWLENRRNRFLFHTAVAIHSTIDGSLSSSLRSNREEKKTQNSEWKQLYEPKDFDGNVIISCVIRLFDTTCSDSVSFFPLLFKQKTR